MLLGNAGLKAPAGMQRRDPAGEETIFDLTEARLPQHFGKIFSIGKKPYAFNEILIGRLVLGDDTADFRQKFEGVEVVKLLEQRRFDLAEFEAEKAPAGLQHAIGLLQSERDVGDVTDAESDGVGIHRFVSERQLLRIPIDPVEAMQPPLVNGAVLADAQHRVIDVEDGDMSLTADAVEKAEGEIAGARSEEHTSELQS